MTGCAKRRNDAFKEIQMTTEANELGRANTMNDKSVGFHCSPEVVLLMADALIDVGAVKQQGNERGRQIFLASKSANPITAGR
jgi:hypothetical protein